MAADAGELKARATLDNAEFLGSLKDMVQQIQANSENAAEHVKGMSEAFSKVGEVVEGLGIAEVVADFAKDCVDAASQLNKLHAGFVALNGSGEETEELFEKMQQLGLHSMFDFADVIGPAAKQMLLLGATAEETENTMTGLVNAAAAMKQGPDWINGVTGAIDNMQAHMVVSARDMKALSQQGIDAWGDLATSLGVSVSQAQAMVKAGTVTASAAIDAVNDDLKRFNGAADLAGNTWKGAMHTLDESAEEAKAAIGNSILKVLNDFAPVLNAIAQAIQDFKGYWSSLSEPVQNAVLALGAAVAIVAAVSAGIAAFGLILPAITAALASFALPVVAAVAALALVGKWIYDEWPAIKAVFLVLWDDIKAGWAADWKVISDWWDAIGDWWKGTTDFFQPVIDFLSTLFEPLAAVWTETWNGIKDILDAVWGGIKGTIDDVANVIGKAVGAVKGFFEGLSNTPLAKQLTDTWNTAQAGIDANAAAVKAHTQALQDNQSEVAKQLQDQKKTEQQNLANANAQKAATAAQKEADAAAKKAAQEQQQYNDSLQKTYAALNAIAPDVAASFNAMYGGMKTDAVDAQKVVGKAWDDIDAAEQKVITDTLAIGDAFKTLGVTSGVALQNAADKAEDAYTTISDSGKATAADLALAFNAVVAANQKVADNLNTEVKAAYAAGKITAADYYDAVVTAAQDAVDKAKADYNDGYATEEDVAAKEKILLADRTAAFKQQQTDYTTAMSAIGEKTTEQLSDATSQWQKYADAIGQRLGTDSKQYIDASIKEVQSLIDQTTAAGKAPPDDLTAWLKSLQQKLEDLKTPAEQFADAMKKLGVNTTQDAVKGINDMAAALAAAKTQSDGSLQSQTDLQLGTKKLEDQIKALVDTYNNQWKTALAAGDITQSQYLQHVQENALKVVQQFAALGTDSPADIAKITAATKVYQDATSALVKGEMADLEKSFKDLGVDSPDALNKMKSAAETDFAAVAASASTNSLTYQDAWINAHKKIYDAITADGTSLSSGQKDDLAKMEQKRDNFLEDQKSAWKTNYDAIYKTVTGAFDGLIDYVVTGKGSFGQVMLTMLEDLGKAVLSAFVEPFEKAIARLIAGSIADLLGKTGLGGISSALSGLGAGIGGAASAGGNVVDEIGSSAAEGGEAVAGAVSDAGSTASTVAGAAISSVTGIVGAVGSVVSAISGIIGNFQMAHQTDILQSIEHNTRYTMLYVGDRADGGILGVLFKIDEEIAWGANTKATENHRDLFKDWSIDSLSSLQDIDTIMRDWGPYIADIKQGIQDIRDLTRELGNTLTQGFSTLSVTINAGNLTTKDAARQLGDTIAQNLATQLVAIKG